MAYLISSLLFLGSYRYGNKRIILVPIGFAVDPKFPTENLPDFLAAGLGVLEEGALQTVPYVVLYARTFLSPFT